jgi:hypothetical protein
MSKILFLDYLTLCLFSRNEEHIEYLDSLLEWGKEYLSENDFQNIIDGRFEKILKTGDKISIRMQPLYICVFRNKLNSFKILEKYGANMILEILDVAIESDIDNIFLQYLLGDKRDYSHSILEFPIRRSYLDKVIFFLDYVQITTTELNEYFKIYDREDTRCKYHLDDNTKNNHKKMIREAYVAKRVKELCYIIYYDKDNNSINIFRNLPPEIFPIIVSFL